MNSRKILWETKKFKEFLLKSCNYVQIPLLNIFLWKINYLITVIDFTGFFDHFQVTQTHRYSRSDLCKRINSQDPIISNSFQCRVPFVVLDSLKWKLILPSLKKRTRVK